MKALSIRQPWAEMILHHGKDIENRDWNTKFRGRFLIHASKAWGRSEKETYNSLADDLGLREGEIRAPEDLPLGCLIGSGELTDVVTSSFSQWFMGDYGFVIRNPIVFKKPIPLKGKLGFFDVEIAEHRIDLTGDKNDG